MSFVDLSKNTLNMSLSVHVMGFTKSGQNNETVPIHLNLGLVLKS